MGWKTALVFHFVATVSLLALFSWHEDNYYRHFFLKKLLKNEFVPSSWVFQKRVLLAKHSHMEHQEEKFFYEIQEVK